MYYCVALHLVVVVEAIRTLFLFDNERHPNIIIYQATFLHRNQVYFAYQAIDTSTHVAFYLEHRFKERQIQQLMLPLKILAIIPFNNWILQFADSVGVTKYFEHSIPDFSLLAVVAVGQDIIRCGLRQRWRKPFYWIDVYHTLHIEQIYCNFNCVILAYLVDWLNIWSVY